MSNSPALFPFTVLRIAGGSVADLQQTELPTTMALNTKIIRNQERIVQLGKIISEDLYDILPSLTDIHRRRLWITVRRDIYNCRPIKYLPPRAYAEFSQALQKTIRSYMQLQIRQRKLEHRAEQCYLAESRAARHAFKELLSSRVNFQNGLLLSSSTIGPSLTEYLDTTPGNEATANVTKKERSFMEYLSRMYTKPSPFSSFTHLALGNFSGENQDLVAFDSFKIHSHIQLNHDLYRYLYGLLVSHPKVRQYLPITLNLTVKKEDSVYIFLTNRHNQEAFQRITATPALDILYAIVSNTPCIRRQEITDLLEKKQYINASREKIAQYIDQLVELGFFELELGVSGIDRGWDRKLAQQLSPLVNNWPELAEVIDGLAIVRKCADEYGSASLTKRQQLLNEAFGACKTVDKLLGTISPTSARNNYEKEKSQKAQQESKVFRHTYSTEFTFKPDRLWYEDTTLKIQPVISKKIEHSSKLLGNLLARMQAFDSCQKKSEIMADFFVRSYGANAKINLLQFYKDCVSNESVIEDRLVMETMRRKQKNEKALDHFLKNLTRITAADEIHFSENAIKHIPPAQQPVSLAAFFQAYRTGRTTSLVLNNIAEGWGKMFSRFLPLFDDEVTTALRQAYGPQSGDKLFAEVTDASFFNANLHPRIMPYEIVMPGSHTALPPHAQLHINDLAVMYDKKLCKLVLIHRPRGKEIVAFDLGFQKREGRSRLYNFLCTFRLNPHHNIQPLLSRINRRFEIHAPGTDTVIIQPRIVYENHIVLQRKTWRVPKEKIPFRKHADTDWTYFLRLQKWRQGLLLPDEVFIKGVGRKPQYISFKNAFLVALFESNSRNCHDTLKITEALPKSSQLAATGQRAVEFLVQWDKLR